MTTLTKDIARKVVKTVDAGLCSGQGEPIPGQMCVEAAVCFALGLPHGDDPKCVGSAVRSFKIALNDSNWSSNAARAKGMRKLAVAQLGSDTINQKKFSELLALKCIQKLCPQLFRELVKLLKTDDDKAAMEKAAVDCAAAVSLKDGLKILESALDLDLARARDLAHDRDLALDLARDLALALARALARDRALALALARDRALARDESLTLIADLALECLIELKSPGCEWLDVCE